MSTKTNFKRIALVAVAALGLGVLTSVAPANAVDNGYLYVYGNGGDSESSRGVVAGDYEESISDKFGKVTMLSTGSLYVKADSLDSEDYNNIIVSGATITSCSGYDLNSTQTVCLDSNENDITATVKPNSGVTSFTINQYNSAVTSVIHRITVSVVAASTVGVFSASKSCIQSFADWNEDLYTDDCNVDSRYDTDSDQGSDLSTGTYATSSPTTTVLNGDTGYLYFELNDSNGNSLSPATTGVTASATGGCVVGFSEATIGTSATNIYGLTGDTVYINKVSPTAAAKCVVTLAVNGAVVSTKTYTMLGEVTKLVVSDIGIAEVGIEDSPFFVDAQDSAGNSIPGISISNGGSLTGAITYLDADNTSYADGGASGYTFCADKGLAKDLKLKTTNDSATTIYSDAFSIQCSGSPVNYTASLDKAVYSIGEVATLTITAKDSKGNLTHDNATLGDYWGNGTGSYPNTDATYSKTAPSIAGGPLVQVGSIISSDSFTSGVKKYKFTVGGISTGSYNLVVDLPFLNNTTYSQAAVPVAYKVVTTADNGVQMNDVLKAIVSLIASINKQIAALQKALLKKK